MGIINKKIENIDEDIYFIIETGIKILKSNTEGGYLKIFYKDGIDVFLGESRLPSHLKYGNMEETLVTFFGLYEKEAKKFAHCTKFHIEKTYSEYSADVIIGYNYKEKVTKKQILNQVEDYLKKKYSGLNISKDKYGMCIVVV